MGLSRGSNIEGGEQGEETGIILRKKLEELEQGGTGEITLERGRNPSSSRTGLCVVAHLPYVA